MGNDHFIFSKEIPGAKETDPTKAKPAGAPAKRKFTSKQSSPSAVPDTAKVAAEIQAAHPLPSVVEERCGSFGLEYIQALTRLLELLSESQREKLVQFIIDWKIL